MLPRGGFYMFDSHRAYVQVIVQAPVAFAIWLGEHDLNTLIRLHSFGLICVPLLFWLAALGLQFKNDLFWLFLVAVTVSYLRSNFFALGEYNAAYGMTAFCTSILLLKRINPPQALALLLTAIVLMRSYELTIFLGVFLTILVTLRLIKVPVDSCSVRVLLIAALLIFIAAAYFGGRSALFERSYDGKSVANLSALKEIHLMYLIVMPTLIALVATRFPQRIRTLVAVGCAMIAICYVAYAFRWDHTNISYGFLSYAYRTLCCFLLMGVLTLAIVFRFWPHFFKTTASEKLVNGHLAVSAFIFFGTMASLLLYHTQGYYKWAQRFEREVVSLTDSLPINKTKINSNQGMIQGYNWGWGNPSLSILLRGNAEAMVLNHSDNRGTNEPSVYENIKPEGANASNKKLELDIYPLRFFEKKGLLF
jgi:hypothetical protein